MYGQQYGPLCRRGNGAALSPRPGVGAASAGKRADRFSEDRAAAGRVEEGTVHYHARAIGFLQRPAATRGRAGQVRPDDRGFVGGYTPRDGDRAEVVIPPSLKLRRARLSFARGYSGRGPPLTEAIASAALL